MKDSKARPRLLHFGVFEVDLRTGELCKQGLKVKLSAQPFQILAMLLEHPGELVTREEIREKLWPGDTFIDFEHSVNNSINRLREALGDDPAAPRFIETLPRRGYRFIAPVQVIASAQGAAPAVEPGSTEVLAASEQPSLEAPSEKGAGAVAQWLRNPQVAIPALLVLLALAVGAGWWIHRSARVRWAREKALPEIERLIGENWQDFTDAYRLAEKAEEHIPHDPKLAELFSKCSLNINIRTEPAGARIYMKEYKAPDSEWQYLGVSPLVKTRVPIGIFRWKIEKEGYETVLAASSTWGVDVVGRKLFTPSDLVRVLDKKGSVPPGMVRVPGTETEVAKLGDFFIDKYEVTNKQYKEFINGGGYRNRKYWKQKLMKEGSELPWEQAVKGFIDQTGQPGPATWQAGDYPEGQADYPVSGISWYEAAAYAEFVGKNLPTGYHWNMARGGYTTLIQVPQFGGYAIFAPFSNFRGKGPVPVGSLPGITSYGAFDMAGNVREWCWNETPKGRLIRGGAWDDNTYMFGDLESSSSPGSFRQERVPMRSLY